MGARARARQTTGMLCALAVVLTGMAACGTAPPQPEPVAHALADGIEARELSAVPLELATAEQAEAQIATALAGLEPLRPTVELGEVVLDEEETTATAQLHVTWDVDAGDADWTYTTTAYLELVEEEWRARWSTFLLAPDLRDTETLSVVRQTAERATVLGAGGAVLVEPRPVVRLGFDKTRLPAVEHDAAARVVATALGIDPEAFAATVAAAGEKAFVEGLVVRTENPGLDVEAARALPGALGVADLLPLAPTRRFARPVLGTAGPATAEIVEDSGGTIAAGDMAGLSGLQRQYDDQLRGQAGLLVVATASDTGAQRTLYSAAPVAGVPLVTTLDPVLQDTAETILEPVAPASALVAMRPSTGEVLAAASGPGSEGYSTATVGTYAPGSVFKVVSALALLRAGLTADSPVECPAATTVEGREFNNFPDYPAAATGTIPLRTAFAHSCNTAFIGVRDRTPPDALVEAAASLGIGVEADLGFPAFLGEVPADATGTDHAASMIGQGRLLVSPLAMATAAASVASGRTVVPWLVGSEPPAAASPASALTAEEAETLRTLMRAVVTEGGAGFLQGGPGPEVLAKTGTAQYAEGGETRNHAWMIAVQGDLAVAVLVADGEYGSTTAGPLLASFLAEAQG